MHLDKKIFEKSAYTNNIPDKCGVLLFDRIAWPCVEPGNILWTRNCIRLNALGTHWNAVI